MVARNHNFIVFANGQLTQADEIEQARQRQDGNGNIRSTATAFVCGRDGISALGVVGIVNIGRRTGDDAGGFVVRELDRKPCRQRRADGAGLGQSAGIGEDGIDITAKRHVDQVGRNL